MERICAYDQCAILFTPTKHNQKYHSDDCCRRATNDRLMRDYYEKKERKQGKARVCETPGCTHPLSRYNAGRVCQKCISEQESAQRQDILRVIAA